MRAGLLALVVLTSGCQSFSSLGRARTVNRGQWQLIAAPQVSGAVGATGALLLPQLELGMRYGLGEQVDVGARVWYAGFSGEARFQLRRAPTLTRSFDLVLVTRPHWTAPNKVGLDVAALGGWNFSERLQLVFGPRVTYQLWVGATPARRPLHLLLAGGAVGLAVNVTQRLILLPEVCLNVPIATDRGLGTSAGQGMGAQLAIGVLF